jgi:hypothetical protein
MFVENINIGGEKVHVGYVCARLSKTGPVSFFFKFHLELLLRSTGTGVEGLTL